MAQPFATLTFTPRAKGKIILLIDFDGHVITGSDWAGSGNYGEYRTWLTQSAATQNGTFMRMSSTRLKYAAQGLFNVEANAEVTCGLELNGGGAFTVAAYNITVRAHLVKETSS
jgi:hypothetical protein